MLRGLVGDGGLFLPEKVALVADWVCILKDQHLARILPLEISSAALKDIYVYFKAYAKNYLKPSWKDLSYTELAFQILSLFILADEIPAEDMKAVIDRGYLAFRAQDITLLLQL